MAGEIEPLRLLAEDAEDLAVIAAAVQDAVGRLGDIHYDPAARRLTLALNRFRWEAGARRRERVRAGLQFGGVLAVSARKLRRGAPDAAVELLTIAFEPGEPPGGEVLLRFSGDGDLRLSVECLDVALADVSEPWSVKSAPAHER